MLSATRYIKPRLLPSLYTRAFGTSNDNKQEAPPSTKSTKDDTVTTSPKGSDDHHASKFHPVHRKTHHPSNPEGHPPTPEIHTIPSSLPDSQLVSETKVAPSDPPGPTIQKRRAHSSGDTR